MRRSTVLSPTRCPTPPVTRKRSHPRDGRRRHAHLPLRLRSWARTVTWLAEWWGLPARLLVGGVWIAAGLIKLPDPAGSVRAVRAYDLLPESVVPLVGHTLPILEIVVGVCLVLG